MGDRTHVLISGAGIAGPTLAYWLVRSGVEVTLVEEAPRLRTGGYIIDFWGLGYDVAEKMGILPALEERGYRLNEVRLVDTHDRRIGGFDAGTFARVTNGRYVSVARGDLAREVFATIDGRVETIFADRVTGLFPATAGVRVAFERSPSREFSLVVGADGLHSDIRRFAFLAGKGETYLGYKVAAFEAQGYPRRDELVYVSYNRPGLHVARFAMRDDRTLFLFVFADDGAGIPEGIEQQRRVLHRRFDDAGWECGDILALLDGCDELYFDRVSQVRLDTWSRGRVVLLGDAAFCPSLLAGEGAGLAMAAAYVLAGEIARAGDDFQAAFARYEWVLKSFIGEKQEAARRFAGAFAPRTQLGLCFRNAVTWAMRVPAIADMALGPSVRDRLTLPDYA